LMLKGDTLQNAKRHARTSSSHVGKHGKCVGARRWVGRETSIKPFDVVEGGVDAEPEEGLHRVDGVAEKHRVGAPMHNGAAILEGRQSLLALGGEGGKGLVVNEVDELREVGLKELLGLRACFRRCHPRVVGPEENYTCMTHGADTLASAPSWGPAATQRPSACACADAALLHGLAHKHCQMKQLGGGTHQSSCRP